MTDPKAPFKSPLRRYFLTGILVTAPIGLTVWMAWEFITWVDRLITPHIPAWANPFGFDLGVVPMAVPGLGLIVVIVALTVIGALMTGFLGRWLTAVIEAIVTRLPVVKTIYSVIKQIFQTALTDQSTAFKEPVWVPFPHAGAMAIGFATARERITIAGDKKVGVFVPTTPNLTSGYLIFVDEKDLRPTDMTSEQALKLIISGGLV